MDPCGELDLCFNNNDGDPNNTTGNAGDIPDSGDAAENVGCTGVGEEVWRIFEVSSGELDFFR